MRQRQWDGALGFEEPDGGLVAIAVGGGMVIWVEVSGISGALRAHGFGRGG